VRDALDADSKMASAPNDPTDRLQPGLAIGAVVANKRGFQCLLERLEGFMKLADLAAEVHCQLPAVLQTIANDSWTNDIGSPMGQTCVGSYIGSIYSEPSEVPQIFKS
jgi:hypothetical protein